MAHIVVHRIEDLARRRLAVAWQRAALPPQPIRADLKLWQLNRVGFAHARTPKMMSRSIGQGTPAQQMLRDNPDVFVTIQNQFPDLDLAALIVSPELPSEVADALQTNVAYYDPNAPSDDQLALYKPSGFSQQAVLAVPSITRDASGDFVHTGGVVPAPCIIREIWFSGPGSTPPGEILLEVEPFGVIYHGSSGDAVSGSIGGSNRGLDRWILSGAVTPRITYMHRAGAGISTDAAQIIVTVEPLQQVA